MLFLYRLLRGKKYRQARRVPFDPANPPRPLRWRPKVKLYGLISGAIGGLGAVVLVAQYGIAPVTNRALSTRGAAGGVTSGFILPSAIFAIVVWRFNRKLAAKGLHPKRSPQLRRPTATAALLLLVGAAGALTYVATNPAAAEVNGPCSATFAGVDAAGATTSAGDAIEVPGDGTVVYTMAAPEDLETWRFWLEYGPFTQLIADGDKDEPNPNDRGLGLRPEDDFLVGIFGDVTVNGNSLSGAIETKDYAWMGAGLYEVHGAVTTVGGTACDGVILIDVTGDPLATALGAAAAGATAIGVAGAGLVTLGGLRDGGEELDRLSGIPDGIDIDGDGIVDIPFEGPVDLDGDGIPDTIDLSQPVLIDEDGNFVPINDRGEAFTWDGNGWRWMPRAEAEGLIAAQLAADADRAAQQADFLEETQRVMDDWLAERVRINEAQAAGERLSRQQIQDAWDRYDRMQNAAIANDMWDILDRLGDDETMFDADGHLDVDRMDRIQEIMRNRHTLDQLAPDPEYGEVGEMIMAVDEVSKHPAVRIAAGLATGGVSEIWYQGRTVVEAVADAAGDSTEYVFDPATGTWVPPSEFGVLDGLRVAADHIALENIPGYNTVRTLGDARATWGDVAGAALWDAIGARLARGELAEAMDQIRGTATHLTGIHLDVPEVGPLHGSSAVDVPTIRAQAGEVIAPPPYSAEFLPEFRHTQEGLSSLRAGEAIPNNVLHETGLTGEQMSRMQSFSDAHSVGVDVRAVNPDSMRHIQSGTAVPKPVDLKPKTLKIEDYYLGACELGDIGKVGMYDPTDFVPRPIPSDASADLLQSIERMRQTRASEITKYGDDVNRYLDDIGGTRDGAILQTADGKAFAGDIDGVRFLDADGNVITDPNRYEQLRDAWTNTNTSQTGSATALGEHGMESNLPGDVVDAHFDSAPRGEPISAQDFVDAQNAAYENGVNLQNRLIENRLNGSDYVIGTRPGGGGLVMGQAVTSDELRQLGESLY